MTSRPVEFAQGGDSRLTGRSVTMRPVTFCGLVLIGALGWCWGAYERFVQLPGVTDIRSTVTLAEVKYTTQVQVRVRHGGQA